MIRLLVRHNSNRLPNLEIPNNRINKRQYSDSHKLIRHNLKLNNRSLVIRNSSKQALALIKLRSQHHFKHLSLNRHQYSNLRRHSQCQ